MTDPSNESDGDSTFTISDRQHKLISIGIVSSICALGFGFGFMRGLSRAKSNAIQIMEIEEEKKGTKRLEIEVMVKKAHLDNQARRVAMRAFQGGTVLAICVTTPIGYAVWRFLKHKGYIQQFHDIKGEASDQESFSFEVESSELESE